MSKVPAQTRFQKLVNDISALYVNARGAQVKFAWETGRRIVEEEQNGAMRAEYGTRLIRELSVNLTKKHGVGFSKSNLERMRQFYKLHQIAPPAGQLGWTDYVELMPVRDGKVRRQIEGRIRKEGLKSKEIRQAVRAVRQSGAANISGAPGGRALQSPEGHALPPLKRPTGLKLNTFSLSPLKVKLKDNQVLIDCGFFVSWPVDKAEVKTLNIADDMAYTYAATVDRVVDGDTLLVLIEVGFGIIVRDRLRLRGINCPEVSTPEGQKAKEHVEKILTAGSTIVVKSHKCQTDVYGRFVADVFYEKDVADPVSIIKNGMYLNQELIDQGLAELF